MPLLTIPDDATRLQICPWVDPMVDRLGHDPRSRYVERFWLPVLGPSTICLLRHLVGLLETEVTGRMIDLGETARALGLGERGGRGGPFGRTLSRAADFEMVRFDGPVLSVRRRMPPLSRRHLSRLPEASRVEHERLVATGADRGPDEVLRKARQLALSLVRLGEDAEATERQLCRWRFDPTLARSCARWAASLPPQPADHPALSPSAQAPTLEIDARRQLDRLQGAAAARP